MSELLNLIAGSFLAEARSADGILERVSRALGRSSNWLAPVAQRYVEAMAGRVRPRRREVVRFLLNDGTFRREWPRVRRKLEFRQPLIESPRMQPVAAAQSWRLPALETAGDLARFLRVTPGELEWFADIKGLGNKLRRPRLSHYHYRVFRKRSGGVRLVEAPQPRLKALQRRILRDILSNIPAHSAAHGFIAGRSIQTFVAPHTGQRVVLKMDLRDFFPGLTSCRIQAFFRTAGYPEAVADLLGGMCTNSAPRELWNRASIAIDPLRREQARILYSRRHLPQGAPASPALSNICAWRVDSRLSGLAKSAGARYTRYADDLAFSGGEAFERCLERFPAHVAAILAEEGFSANHRKTRIMRQGVRQHLAGLVVNRRANIMRTDFDLLKATLVNCARTGPAGQNRASVPDFRSHLEGRVGFIESINPAKGLRLRALLAAIDWSR